MKRTVILDPFFRKLEQIFIPADLRRLRGFANVVWGRNAEMPQLELARHRKEAAAIVSGWWRHGSPADYPKLRAFIEVGGGLPNPKQFDYPTCFARGIMVMSCAPAFGPAVAELALASALAAARDLARWDRAFRHGNEIWEVNGNEKSFTLFDKTVGFIGFGSLARNLKVLIAPFRCPILAYDPWQSKKRLRAQGAIPTGLDELLKKARVIFVLAIPTPENKEMLNRKKLGMIRRDSVLVLISRSHLVDFEAMTDLVLRGRFKATVDVFPVEPLPKTHRLRKAVGAVLTPHKGGAISDGLLNIGRMVVDDLELILAGRSPQKMQVARPDFVRHL